jgi:two-component sensor histidine kinase
VSEGEEVVDFAPFTEALARELLSVYQAEERVEVHAEVDSVLDLQAASPLALILSELISNALRHGFPSPGEGNLHVWMRVKGGQGELRVRNDGIPESQTARNPSGMGLQIVKTLANQIGGSLEKIDTTETEFRVYFKTSLRD